MRFIDLKLFLLLFACVAGAVMYESPARSRTLVETRDPWSIAIAGRGYFSINVPIDGNGNILYTRAGKLSVNNFGQLCILAQGKEFMVEPQISVPGDWTAFRISAEGHVEVQQARGSYASIGQLQLANFQACPVFEDDFSANLPQDKHGQPSIANPGENGTGQVLQGWLEQPTDTVTYRYAKPILIGSIIAVVLKALLDANNAQEKMQQLLQAKQPPLEL